MADGGSNDTRAKVQSRPRNRNPRGERPFRPRQSNPQLTSALDGLNHQTTQEPNAEINRQPNRQTYSNQGPNRNQRSNQRPMVSSSLNPGASSFRPNNNSRGQNNLDDSTSNPPIRPGVEQYRRQRGRISDDGNWRNRPRSDGTRPVENPDNARVVTRNPRMAKNLKSILDPNADPESQKAQLEEQLSNGSYECMICCEEIKTTEFIWSCTNSCFNIFHLACISTWACSLVTQTNEQNQAGASNAPNVTGWRCPACQFVMDKVPNRYFCFCGKRRNPDIVTKREIETNADHRIPHTCGQMCLRRKNGKNSKCPHKCKLNCHPGPCPPCIVGTKQTCACGRTSRPVKCGESGREIFTCENVCGKQLSCGIHSCTKTCHEDDCKSCDEDIVLNCFCGKNTKSVKCSADSLTGEKFECENICGQELACGNHFCKELCHPGRCPDCKLSPNVIDSCHCGKKKLEELSVKKRVSCLDEIPVCFSKCEKDLICGPENELHKCSRICHPGPCSKCKLKTVIRCSCGKNSLSVECKDLDPSRTFKCTMKCNRKMSCGRHRCTASCCNKAANNHGCDQICGKKLSCGNHNCQEVCHSGPCPKCWNVGWEDLTCFCGSSVIHPPIHCGIKVPKCDQPCTRTHNCGHPVAHPCHSENVCPPCTFTTSKKCFGGHELLSAVLCCLDGSSCGKTCAKKMPCGVHECQKVCHEGSCGTCSYPCLKPRNDCEHPCGLPCHEQKECPKSDCKVMLSVHCACKRLQSKMSCSKVNDEVNNKIPFALMAKLRVNQDEEIDVSELIRRGKENKFVRIECDKTCLQLERNRNLAEAFDIQEKPIETLPAPNYNETLKQSALSDPQFVAYVYTTLSDLVSDVNKQSTSKFKFYNFPAMRSDLRQIVHEMSEFFGCKSHSNDPEPHRSVTVKASKGKCFIPSVSIMDVIKNEKKVKPEKSVPKRTEKFTNLSSLKPIKNVAAKKEPSNPVIDYFDFTSS